MTHSAKYLVLTDAAPRALLFDHHQRLLGEVIEDDGFIVDSLIDRATACAVPDPEMLDAMVPPASSAFPVRCFELNVVGSDEMDVPQRAHDRPPVPSEQPPHEPPPVPVREPSVPEHPDPMRDPPTNRPPVSASR